MNTVFLIEFALLDVAALSWAGYELWSLRRSKWPDDKKKPDKPSEEPPRHPEG